MSHLVLLYYKFVQVDDPEAERAQQLAWGTELGLRGRVIIAHEGINGTLSGMTADAEEYMARMHRHELFEGIEFKFDPHDQQAFKRLSVKVRPEIVTLGMDVDSINHTGKHLEPKEFRDKLSDPNALILDIRNDYEFEMGRFRGAVRPPLESFREFPTWIADHFGNDKDRPILTYCTGGIRCEKLTAYLVEQGYRDVYQLHGGIVTYAKDPDVKGEGFDGDCFMFDDRLSVPVGPPVNKCEGCEEPTSRYVNCTNVDCNRLYFLCADCESTRGLACTPACEQVVRVREKNAVLSPPLRSPGKAERKKRHREKRKLATQTEQSRTKLNS